MANVRHQAYAHVPNVDVEGGELKGLSDFADKALRAGFIRKVFGLLSIQLLLTTVIGAAATFSPVVKTFLFANPGIALVAALGGFALVLTFTFSERARSSHPTNLILLTAFTICESLLVAYACGRYPADLVITAAALTAAVSGGLAFYALTTKRDFTPMLGVACSMCWAFLTLVFMGALFRSSWFNLGLSFMGAGLFSLYLVFDIQMLMGGDHRFKLSPDDYIMATITIYLDIINLFMEILRILAELRRD